VRESGAGPPTRTSGPSQPDGLGSSLNRAGWVRPAPEDRICGSLGCRRPASVEFAHPDYGTRVVCFVHSVDLLDDLADGRSDDDDRDDRQEGGRRVSGANPSARSAVGLRREGRPTVQRRGRARPAGAREARRTAPTSTRWDRLTNRRAQCPARPRVTGTCFLRRFSGSVRLLAGGRAGDASKSGVIR